MANKSLFEYFFISSLVFLNIFASDTLPDYICRQTHDPSLCMSIFASDYRSATANIYMLAADVVDIGTDLATSTKVKIHSILLSGKVGPNMELQLVKCYQLYVVSIDFLRNAGHALKDYDYESYEQSGAQAYTSASQCEDELSKPPSNSSMFTDENRRMQTLGEIIYYIGEMLPQD